MTIGWALVSPGAHAETLLAPAIGAAEGARFVAVCSRDPERAEAFADRHGAQVAYSSVENLVGDTRIDAVLIASPNFLHARYTTVAARAGKRARRAAERRQTANPDPRAATNAAGAGGVAARAVKHGTINHKATSRQDERATQGSDSRR